MNDEKNDLMERIAHAPVAPEFLAKSETADIAGYANCRGCGNLFARRKGGARAVCRACIAAGVRV